jgi:hypothetical protein
MKMKWTEEAIIADAKRFTTRKEWEKSSIGAYSAAHKRGLMDVACAHMVFVRKYWTDDEIIADAKQYETRRSWKLASEKAYAVACYRGLLDVACAHMRFAYEYKTNDEIIADAKRFNTRSEWEKESKKAYSVAQERGLLGIACEHMSYIRKYWTDEEILKEALQYTKVIDWRTSSPKSYDAAIRRNLTAKASAHMDRAARSWTDDEIIADAKQFKTRSEWERCSPAYQMGLKRKLMDVACAHMEKGVKKPHLWTKENILADAGRFYTRAEWRMEKNGAYSAAHKTGVMEEACAHMPISPRASSADVIYIWRAVGEDFNGKQVYKIGLTSTRVKDWRIKKCSRSSGFEADIVLFAEVGPGMAYSIEDEVLKIGTHPEYSGFDGCTEFRALSEDELNKAISLINLRAACESSAQ